MRRTCKAISPILLLFFALFNSNVPAQQDSGKAKGFFIDSQPQGADVHIENEIIGKTPCWFPYQLSGRYKVWAEKRGYENDARLVDFGKTPLAPLHLTLSPKNAGKALLRSMFVAGWGQSYSEQNIKGKIFFAVQVATLLSTGYAQYRYKQRHDDYKASLKKYELTSRSFVAEATAWTAVTKAYSKLDDAHRLRQVMLIAAATVYAVNVFDALFLFPDNLRQLEILGLPISKPEISYNRNMITLSWAL